VYDIIPKGSQVVRGVGGGRYRMPWPAMGCRGLRPANTYRDPLIPHFFLVPWGGHLMPIGTTLFDSSWVAMWRPWAILSFATARKGVFKLEAGLATGLHLIGAVKKPACLKGDSVFEGYGCCCYRLIHLYLLLTRGFAQTPALENTPR
jgi:hypothetical protein